jgi:Fe-S-cluster containining protein
MVECRRCGVCCNYVSVQIDPPEDMIDYDEIVWYLLHNNIAVYIDHEDDWYVEFRTPCKALGKDNNCNIYEERPYVCRDHDPENCEMSGQGLPYKKIFTEREQFIKYLKEKKNVDYDPMKVPEAIEALDED